MACRPRPYKRIMFCVSTPCEQSTFLSLRAVMRWAQRVQVPKTSPPLRLFPSMVCTQRCATLCFFHGDHNDIDLRTKKEGIQKALSLGIYVLHLDALHACLQRYAKSASFAMDALLVNVIRNPLHLAQRAARARFLDCSFNAGAKHHLQICLDDLSFLCASFLCCRRSYFLRAYFSSRLCAWLSRNFFIRACC